jgi:hypothetical protein
MRVTTHDSQLDSQLWQTKENQGHVQGQTQSTKASAAIYQKEIFSVMKYLVTFSTAFAVIIGFNVFLAMRDAQLNKAYDACMAQQPSCPDSWKTKPAFSHR